MNSLRFDPLTAFARSCRPQGLLLAALCLAPGCTSYESTKIEFDSLAGINERLLSEAPTLSYADSYLAKPGLAGTFDGSVFGDIVEAVFGSERRQSKVVEKGDFVRKRMAWMVEFCNGDRVRIAETAWRILLVLEKDGSALNRSLANEHCGTLLKQLGIGALSAEMAQQLLGPRQSRENAGALREALRPLLGVLRRTWPGKRKSVLEAAERRNHARVLQAFQELPPLGLAGARDRLPVLLEATRDEDIAELAELSARLLAKSTVLALMRGLFLSFHDSKWSVRDSAVKEVWDLGGASVLPWLLAQFDKRQSGRTDGADLPRTTLRLIDDSDELRRRLIQCCWSLDKESAALRHGDALSPFKFLHDTAIYDPSPSLRFLAREALAHVLERENDRRTLWVSTWWQDFVSLEGSGQQPGR